MLNLMCCHVRWAFAFTPIKLLIAKEKSLRLLAYAF